MKSLFTDFARRFASIHFRHICFSAMRMCCAAVSMRITALLFYFPDVCSGQLQPGAPWPVWGGGVQHTGFSASTLTRQSAYSWGDGSYGMQQRWAFQINSSIQSSTAIDAQGNLYFGTETGAIYSLYPNGTASWVFQIPV